MRVLDVLAPDTGLSGSIPRTSSIRTFRSPSSKDLLRSKDVFVLVSWDMLSDVAPFIRKAGERGVLRGIFVDTGSDVVTGLIPAYLNHIRMRYLRNLVVHTGPDIPVRVLNAYAIGAERELIADAVSTGSELFVVSCSFDAYRVPFDSIPALQDLGRDAARFKVAQDGSHIHWSAHDIHLDLESIRFAIDDDFRLRTSFEILTHWKSFGGAIKQIRKHARLRQSDIDGLSERQVRRIEQGAGTSIESMRRLAHAHDMELSDYLEAVSRIESRPQNAGSLEKRKTSPRWSDVMSPTNSK